MRLALLALLTCLLFVTCTGCAAVVIKADGTVVGYAVGQSKMQMQKTPKKIGCTEMVEDHDVPAVTPGRQLVYSSRRQLVYSSRRQLVYSSGRPAKHCIQEGEGLTVNVEGGNLGAGWFGAITTFLLLYFAPVGAVL